jgi:hypothetical protein
VYPETPKIKTPISAGGVTVSRPEPFKQSVANPRTSVDSGGRGFLSAFCVDQFSNAIVFRRMPAPRSLSNLRWAFFAFRLILSSLVGLATSTVSNTPESIATVFNTEQTGIPFLAILLGS